MELQIRRETAQDYRAVEELTRDAFWNVNFPGCSEHLLIHNIRNSPAYIPELDLVAEMNGRLVGHIAYTKAVIINHSGEEFPLVSFGPVSVHPELQKQGVGTRLINHSLTVAKAMGYPAVCIYGDPRYYSRFGFRCAEKYDIRTSGGKFAVALLALELQPEALAGQDGRFCEDTVFDVNETELESFDRSFPHKEKAVTESQQTFMLMISLQY